MLRAISRRSPRPALYYLLHFQPPRTFHRCINSTSYRPRAWYRRPSILVGGLLGASLVAPLYLDTVPDDADDAKPVQSTLSLGALVRSYVVFSLCSLPWLVDASPKLLEVLTSIPVLKNITETFVRVTFFDQFVGGDTAEGALPIIRQLRSDNKGCLFAYSVEVEDVKVPRAASQSVNNFATNQHEQFVQDMIHCIDVAADFERDVAKTSASGRRTWVAVKMTALVPDAQALINLSKYIVSSRESSSLPIPFPGCPQPRDLDVLDQPDQAALSNEDVQALRKLRTDLTRISSRAHERGVKIIIDAEYSWFQPAIDAFQLDLMRKFNRLTSNPDDTQPLIYGTWQAYLRRTPTHLLQSVKDAKAYGYSLGVKLVRGAYHSHEMDAFKARASGKDSYAISPDHDLPPVWLAKSETDACYNECAKVLVQAIKDDTAPTSSGWIKSSKSGAQTVGVLFGSHNWESCRLILNELERHGLARRIGENGSDPIINVDELVAERVTFGQLYGMSDDLTDFLVTQAKSTVPIVIKYVPYGGLSEVMPYLSRRAIENKSVLGNGGAAKERRRAGAEIRARLFGR